MAALVLPGDKDAQLEPLRKIDPDAEQVLASSGHVVLYNMSVATQQWQRKNVEGSLFLLKRRSSPRFQLMILNKMATDNYVEDVQGGLDFEVNPPYLMYTKGNSEILGIWFYEQQDLHKVEEMLNRIRAQAPVNGAAVHQPAGASNGDDQFWDKPAAKAAQKQHQHPAQQVAAAGQAPPPAQRQQVPAASLQNLLRAAHVKHQQQNPAGVPVEPQPAPAAGGGGPLPPSFFQPRGAAPVAPPPQPQPAAPTGQPNALLKLFANANKAPQQHAVIPAAPSPVPVPPAQPVPVLPATPPAAAAPPAAAHANADREKVVRLLNRMAGNEALLDMLVVEMKAVGLLR